MTIDGVIIPGVRALLRMSKTPRDPSRGWQVEPIPPGAFIFPKQRRPPPDGAWRGLRLKAGERDFSLLVLSQPDLNEIKAWLAYKHDGAWYVIARLEQHGDHPGIHVHDCCGLPMPPGPPSISAANNRRPRGRAFHRLNHILSREEFYAFVLKRFRIRSVFSSQGSLEV